MSDTLDIDADLSALRNELLTSLTKKNLKKPETLNESPKDQVSDEDDLEILRLEALNAKRIKTQSKLNFLNKVDDTKKNNNIPGRFRYDKESDEEEEDEDEFTLRNHKNSEDYEDSINSKYKYYNPQPTDSDFTNKSPEVCNYHFNYQTYRAECSKLMANDAYDPNSIHDRQEPEGFDLRNFLREKAYKHQQENEVRLSQSSSILMKTNDDGDVVYEKPITQPINIKSELNKLKGKNYFDYFNNSNRRKNFRMGSRDNHSDYFDNRNSFSNEKYQFVNKKLSRTNSCNEEKDFKNEKEHKKEFDQSNDEEETSDEDSASNCKKLRSVVAVISNKR